MVVKHEDFRQGLRDAAIGDALEAIEGRILPSLTFLIESAAMDGPGSAGRAEELKVLAAELELLTSLIGPSPTR